jgi:hypothetical protein
MAKFRTVVSSLSDLIGRALGRVLRGRARAGPDFEPEELLLEEAEVTAPIAPGMAGRVKVRKRGVASDVFAKGERADQAFARGMRVRLIDYRDGAYLVEPADEEHLVH